MYISNQDKIFSRFALKICQVITEKIKTLYK